MQKYIFSGIIAVITFLTPSLSFADTSCLSVKIPEELDIAFEKATENIPCELIDSLQTIEIFEDENLPRAMANARILKVNKSALDDEEIVNVLIHELGHVVDLGELTSSKYNNPSAFKDGNEPVYEDDSSFDFYSLSFLSEKTRKADAIVQDFAGEYASTDPFEDFAEGFLLYVQHGNSFRKMARHNTIMAKKYSFFKEIIFKGTEFNTGNRKISADKRIWDVTKL